MSKKISSREFNQDTSGAKKASLDGPVFITSRGKPAHVLLSYQHYLQLTGDGKTIGELLSLPGAEAIDLELPPPHLAELARPADLA